MHNLLAFPQSAEQQPSLDSIKVRILGTLADVEADVPSCYLKKPVDIVEIYRFCYMDGSLGEWVRAATELSKAGLVLMWLHLGKTCIEFTELGKERVMNPPELPDYPGDQGDETEPITSGLSASRVFGTQCETEAGGFTHNRAEQSAAIGKTGYGQTTDKSVEYPASDKPRTIPQIAGPLAVQELDQNRRNYLREIDDEITDAPAERELWRNR